MKKLTRFLCAVALCVVAFSGPSAQESVPASSPPPLPIDESTLVLAEVPEQEIQVPETALFPYVLRMIIVLALIVAAIYGLYALVKRSSRPRSEEDTSIKVLASSPLGAGKMLHVVSVGDRAWLLAAADAAISVVSEIEDKEIIDALTLRASAAPGRVRNDFASSLVRLLTRSAGTGGAVSSSSDFLARQRDRLKKM